ncbi:MAG: hypothetical protein DMF92_13580 [Acidobacteria bacterium]|nr:MAG: hypothetical protein DMF92_13580 [Acidobacteriota bacterium]
MNHRGQATTAAPSELIEHNWRNDRRRARRARRGAAATARPAQQAGGFATAVAAARPSALSALYVAVIHGTPLTVFTGTDSAGTRH